MTKPTYSGVVLAGGSSRRMGQDKRFLEFDGAPLLAHVLARLRPLVSELIVVAQDLEPLSGLDARLVTDRYPGMGVLAGVHAGLSAAHTPWAFVVAGDMPLLSRTLLRAMAELTAAASPVGTPDDSTTYDVVVPRWQGELEPLHGLYRAAECAAAAERALLAGRRRIIAFYPEVRVHIVPEADVRRWDPSGESFCNVNTPEDWNLVRKRL